MKPPAGASDSGLMSSAAVDAHSSTASLPTPHFTQATLIMSSVPPQPPRKPQNTQVGPQHIEVFFICDKKDFKKKS